MAIILKKDTFLQRKKYQTTKEVHEHREKSRKLMSKENKIKGTFKALISKWFLIAIPAIGVYFAKDSSEDIFLLSLFILLLGVIFAIGHTRRPHEERAAQEINKASETIREYRPWRKGLIGEESVSQSLNRLSDEYYIINDITIKDKDKSQIDHVVVGPTGVFAIETKSMGGNLRPHPEGWLQGRTKIRSPQGQSKKGAVILAGLINERVLAVVALSNPKAKWLGDQEKLCPVLSSQQIPKYILNQPRRISNPEEVAYEVLRNSVPY